MTHPTDFPASTLRCRTEIIEQTPGGIPGREAWSRALIGLADVRHVREAFDPEFEPRADACVFDTYSGDQLTVDVPFERAAAIVERYRQHMMMITRLKN